MTINDCFDEMKRIGERIKRCQPASIFVLHPSGVRSELSAFDDWLFSVMLHSENHQSQANVCVKLCVCLSGSMPSTVLSSNVPSYYSKSSLSTTFHCN